MTETTLQQEVHWFPTSSRAFVALLATLPLFVLLILLLAGFPAWSGALVWSGVLVGALFKPRVIVRPQRLVIERALGVEGSRISLFRTDVDLDEVRFVLLRHGVKSIAVWVELRSGERIEVVTQPPHRRAQLERLHRSIQRVLMARERAEPRGSIASLVRLQRVAAGREPTTRE